MISVCVATYNGAKYIRRQLDSIRVQLADTDEIIVSDDMSSDSTLQEIRNIGDERIKIYSHAKEHAKFVIDYATRNFENALSHAKGDIIFLSDQDDVWLPDKVDVMLEALKNSDMVMSDCCTTDQDLHIISNSYYGTERSFKPSIIYNFAKPSFLGSCMAFRRNILDLALPFPRYGVGHDLWLGLIGIKYYKFSFINKPLILYRRHKSTVTDGGKANNTSLMFKIKYRMYVLFALVRLLSKGRK